jgi:hypothetical protein
MLIPKEDAALFFKIYPALIGYGYSKGGGPLKIHDKISFDKALPEDRAEARDYVMANRNLMDEYVMNNPDHLSKELLEIVSTWKLAIQGQFIVERDLKAHTIFLYTKGGTRAFGVLGLSMVSLRGRCVI